MWFLQVQPLLTLVHFPPFVSLSLGQVPVIPSGLRSDSISLKASLVFTDISGHSTLFTLIALSVILLCVFNASSVAISICKIKTEPNNGQTLAKNLIPTNESLTTWNFCNVIQTFDGVS